jgi:hypothetical protein
VRIGEGVAVCVGYGWCKVGAWVVSGWRGAARCMETFGKEAEMFECECSDGRVFVEWACTLCTEGVVR